MLTAQQKNYRSNLLDTIGNFASFERQASYKQNVPFVHTPDELLLQWASYSSLLKEQRGWFISSFSSEEIALLNTFDDEIRHFRPSTLADVPEIFENPAWMKLRASAET